MTATFIHFRTLSLGSLTALSLAACNGRLDVIDDGLGGAAGSSSSAGSGGGSSGAGGDAGTCSDGVLNGDETAADCGGASCPACPEPRCTNPVECEHGVCLDGVCQAPSCEDGVRNGDEAGVDCGGTSGCGPCLTLCQEQCAVSDALLPLGCDPSAPAPVGVASRPRSNEDGTVIAFDYCYEDSRCTPMYWSATDGARAFTVTSGALLAGMSADGQVLLVSPQVALGGEPLLFAPDGTSTPSGMGQAPAIMSADGALVGVSPPGSDPLTLLRRPRGGAAEPLGQLPFAANEFTLSGVTPDASVIVGYSFEDGYQPFRYTPSGGLVFGLEGLPEPADGASIHALSRDGQVMAGLTALGGQQLNVFRWTEADGVIDLGPIPALTPGVDPGSMALSDDGSVLVFSRETDAQAGDFGGYRWTAAGGAEALTPGIQSIATLVSGDGGVIIGQTFDLEEYRAFVWTEARGARSIRASLEAAGVDLEGWSFDRPVSLSGDGKVALGVGRCGDIPTVYRLVLPD